MQTHLHFSEEALTEAATAISDEIINRDLSVYGQIYNNCIDLGMSEADAKEYAFNKFLEDVGLAGAGGALMGGGMAGAFGGANLATGGTQFQSLEQAFIDEFVAAGFSEDAAKRIIALLRETDQVEIIVGTKINDEIDDPSMAAKIGLRFPTIDEIRRSLDKNFFKECEVMYL